MHKVYTLGYTGLKPAQVKFLVDQFGAMLVDIRYSPRSRVPRWSQAALRELVGPGNYVWCQALGNRNYNSGGPVELNAPGRAIVELRPILEQRPVILLCACESWLMCHRADAADWLRERLGVEVAHLRGNEGK